MREIDISLLPKLNGKLSDSVNWRLAAEQNLDIPFIYDNIKGVLHLKGYRRDKNIALLTFEYNNKRYERSVNVVKTCSLGTIIEVYSDKLKIGEHIKNDKTDVTILDICNIDNKLLYRVKCNKCGYISCKTNNQIKNSGCACCHNLVVISGINDIPTTDPWMISYFQGGEEEARLYHSGSTNKIIPVCPDCGRIKDKSMPIREIKEKHSIGCTCGDSVSYPNKFIYSIFEQLEIEFYREFRISNINQMRFDFMFKINEDKYLVEADGGLHFKDGFSSKEEQENNDNFKNKLAKDNGYILIRIPTLKSNKKFIINDILNSELAKIFDLSKINWDKCDEDATNNIVKLVCDYTNKHPNMTQKEIAEIFQLSISAISKYLRKGKSFGWCNYQNKDPNENKIKTYTSNTSGVTGVWWNKKYNKWQADIIVNGNKIYLGRFLDIEDAAKVRKEAEDKYFIKKETD